MYYTEIIYTSTITQNLQFVLFCLFVCLFIKEWLSNDAHISYVIQFNFQNF